VGGTACIVNPGTGSNPRLRIQRLSRPDRIVWIHPSCRFLRCLLASRLIFFVQGSCTCVSAQLALGGDDHGRGGKHDDRAEIKNLTVFDAGTTSQESWLIAPSKLAKKIAINSTLLAVTL
jgi:hypothetical protein